MPDAVTPKHIEALNQHFRSSHAGFARGATRHVEDTVRIPVVTTSMDTLDLRLTGEGRDQVITTDGSATSGQGRGKTSACAAVAWDGRVTVGWYRTPAEVRGESVYAEWRALLLGLRLVAASPGPVTLVTDNPKAAEQLRRVQRGERVQHAFLSCRDEPATREMVRLAKGLTFTVACLEGKRSDDTAAATVTANAAHTLAFTVRRLAECGVDPRTELEFLQHAAARSSRAEKTLRDMVSRRVDAIGRGETVWTDYSQLRQQG